MFESWNDFGRTLALMDQMRERLESAFSGDGFRLSSGLEPYTETAVQTAIAETPDAIVFKAGLPGFLQSDLKVTLADDVMTLSGTRKKEPPKGYTVHREERSHMEFSQSVPLPTRVDGEKASAILKDGILTVTVPKHAEAKARHIDVKAT